MSARKYKPLTPVLFLSGGGALLAVGVIFQGRLPSSRWPWAEYVIFGAAYLLAGWNVLAAAVPNIGRGRVFDENFLMIVAIAGAFAVHELWEAVAVMVLYKVGEVLEDLSVDRSWRSISKLLALRAALSR
jgi:Cd2+/Zn2+-exporting ATPase